MINNININIPKNISIAINMLTEKGYEAGIVGGCIRDRIMGIKPNDWDLCTSATPKEIQEVFKDFKQLIIGLKHGTIVVFINNEKIEITTYRIDGIYSDGRRPDQVAFTRNLTEDLKRRDFTQNAIFYNDKIGLIDPFNGVSDIKNKVIRCVGNPEKRLKEDALRILRGIRFSSKFGFTIDDKTKKAMLKNKKLLRNIAQERITEEFIKILQGKYASNTLNEFKEIIAYIIPETKVLMEFKQDNPYHMYDVWNYTLKTVNNVEDLTLKITMFFHDIGKPFVYEIDEKGIRHFYNHAEISAKITFEIFKRMKMTSAMDLNQNILKDIIELIRYHDIEIEENKKSVRKCLFKLGGNKNQFKRLLLVKKADILVQNPTKQLERLNKLYNIESILGKVILENPCITLKDLAITGNDLINIGVPKGEKIGEILDILLQKVINETLKNEKKILLLEAKKLKNEY